MVVHTRWNTTNEDRSTVDFNGTTWKIWIHTEVSLTHVGQMGTHCPVVAAVAAVEALETVGILEAFVAFEGNLEASEAYLEFEVAEASEAIGQFAVSFAAFES
ncbi:hypothetical protein WICPIJ_001189 [Wickerhamomyces pijperi]|uniref:Uncharacterized protein n=1 Tax=Wickerhamomyces pijperi TaxID=599730 RepID=A0A9P8TR08_WICPI|nr:hypothetical protein WICPIJ_001189 [Wickerhamomyces pijperi]